MVSGFSQPFSLVIVSEYARLTISRVPKELISRFVKLCPTCQVRRGSARASPPETDPGSYMHTRSPGFMSPPLSRRESIATRKSSMDIHSPTSHMGGTSDFQRQNRWMMPAQPSHSSHAGLSTMSSSNYNNLPGNPSMNATGSVNSTHISSSNHMNFNTAVNNDSQSSYNSNGLRFAHTSQGAFPFPGMKQEGDY